MNKKEAAEFLKVSEKTIERYKSAGKLSARMIRTTGDDGKTRQVLDFKDTELQKLKEELSGEIVFPMVTDGQAQTKTQTDTDRQTQLDRLNIANAESLTLGQTQTANLFEVIFKSLETISERQIETSNRFQKLMLTVDEAAAVCGLPKAFINRAIKKDATLKATKIGGRYRIKRQDLNEFINSL
jgi:excisionase family DNA binding protein